MAKLRGRQQLMPANGSQTVTAASVQCVVSCLAAPVTLTGRDDVKLQNDSVRLTSRNSRLTRVALLLEISSVGFSKRMPDSGF